MTIAPWLMPPDFLSAMKAGASLGAEVRSGDAERSVKAQEAADRLRLGYAQLGASVNEHSASILAQQQQAAAAMALRGQQESALEKYRQGQLANQQQREALAERKNAAADALRSNIAEHTAGFFSDLSKPDTSGKTDEYGLPVGGPMDEMSLPTGEEKPTPLTALRDNPLASHDPTVKAIVSQHLKEAATGGTGPLQTQPLLDPVTKLPIPGMAGLPGHGGAAHIFPTTPKGDNTAAALLKEGRKFKLSQIAKDLTEAKKELSALPSASPRRPAAAAAVEALKQQSEALLSPGASGTSTNKVLRWNPNTNDFE